MVTQSNLSCIELYPGPHIFLPSSPIALERLSLYISDLDVGILVISVVPFVAGLL